MAARDVKFYNYLKEALKNKLRYPQAEAFKLGDYFFDYEYIFQQARRVFPAKYNIGHSYLNGTPISYLNKEDLKKLNLEYAQDIVQGFGGLDEKQLNKKELDAVLVEYENELTAPEEPESFHQELQAHQLPAEEEKPEEGQPEQQNQQGEESSAPQRPQRQPPSHPPVIVRQQREPMTKEEYAKYKEENNKARAARARELWEQRKADRESQNENEEEKKKKRLGRPESNQSPVKNPLSNRINNWLKNKFNNTRLGKALQNLKGRFANTGLGRGLARINNLLNAPSRFLSRMAGNLGRVAGNALRSLGSQALRGMLGLGRTALGALGRGVAGLTSRVATHALTAAGRGLIAGAAAIGVTGFIIITITILTLLALWFLYDSIRECGQPGTITALKSAKKESYVDESENIEFHIVITYNVKCPDAYADIEVRDVIPANTTFVERSASSGMVAQSFALPGIFSQTIPFFAPEGKLEGNTITWKLNKVGPNKPTVLVFSVTPNQNNVWITNQATISYKTYTINFLGLGSSSTGGGTPVDPSSVASSADFDTLMRGQGRNVNVMGGSEEEFIAKVRQNLENTGRAGVLSFEDLIRKIYRAYTAKGVNPLIGLTLWGEESGFNTSASGIAFGCDPRGVIGIGKDFDSQLQCSVNTWNNRMNEFKEEDKDGDGKVQLPSNIGETCIYDDEFLYAAERYGPRCVIYDGNENFVRNFSSIYKMILGVK